VRNICKTPSLNTFVWSGGNCGRTIIKFDSVIRTKLEHRIEKHLTWLHKMKFENVKSSEIIIYALNIFYKAFMNQFKVLLMKSDTVKHTSILSHFLYAC